MNQSCTYNNTDNPHKETLEIEKNIKSHIEWALNNKDIETLHSTLSTQFKRYNCRI